MTIHDALATLKAKRHIADRPPAFVDCASDKVRNWILDCMDDGGATQFVIDWLVANVPAELLKDAAEMAQEWEAAEVAA